MKRRLSILMALVFLFTAVFSASFGAVYAADDEYRIAGGDRYETACLIAKAKYSSAETVIIVRGDDNEKKEPQVVDGLTASVLAGAKNAPILLTAKDELSEPVADTIEALGAKKAYIIGGPNAVSEAVEEALKKLGLETERVQGDERYETAVAIAEKANTGAKTAIITNAFTLVDSLVAGPLAYEKGYPILLVEKDKIADATKDAIEDLGIENIIIVGGEGVVSEDVEEALKDLVSGTVSRLGGEDRFETSLKVAKFLDKNEVALVNGMKFVDAVAASTLGLPILYVEHANMSDDIEDYLATRGGVKVIGGEVAISKDVAKKANELVKFEVVSVNALGDNKIQITFSGNVSDKVEAKNFEVENRTVIDVDVDGNKVVLTLNSVMVDGTSYKVTVKDVANASGTKKVDEYTYTLKYEFASVKEITLSKTTFKANVGEFVTKYVVVKDENGTILTMEDYQITTVESKNHDIVDTKGEVKNPGETEVRFEVTHKNGEVKWSDWIAVKSEGLTLENGIAWTLLETDASIADNKKVFSEGQNWIYNNGTLKLVVFRDYANGDTIGRHIDLRATNSMDKAKVTNNTPSLIAVKSLEDGTLEVQGLDNGRTGTASITIEYELEGKTYKNTITFEVKAKPVLSGIKSISKQTLMVANKAGIEEEETLTSLADIESKFGTGEEDGIDIVSINLSTIFKDQYGNDYTVDFDSVTTTGNGVWVLQHSTNNYKMVISVPANVLDNVDISIDGNDLVIKSKETAVSQFYITVTYYKDKNATTKTYERKIPVEVKDTDGKIANYKFIPVVNDKDVSSIVLDAAKPEERTVTFKVAALDKYGNVLTYKVTDLARITYDASLSLSKAARDYTDIVEADGVPATTGVGFIGDADIYYAGSETARVKVQVIDGSDVKATNVFSINLTNSNPVPVKAVLSEEITIDLSEALAAKKAVDPTATDVTLKDVLFGVINPKEMDPDDYDPSLDPRSSVYYGAKAGLDGYVDGLAPALKLYDRNNKLVTTKPFVYGATADDLSLVDTLAYCDKAVKVSAKAVNIDSTVDSESLPTDDYKELEGTELLKLVGNAQKGSFTLIINKVEIDGGDNILKDGQTITIRVKLTK